MTRILVPRASGVLSALGLAAADRRADAQRTVLGDDEASVDALRRRGRARRWAASRRSRSPGTCATAASRTSSPCAARERDELRERFEALHEERYGHRDPDGEVELVTVRVTGRLPAPPVDFGAPGRRAGRRADRRRAARGDARRARGLERERPTTPARSCWSGA